MTAAPPSLAGASWLESPVVRTIFRTLEQDGDSARIIGGAVRNALLGLRVDELDFATTATPDIVIRRAEAAGLKAVPTGVEHGTVTLVGGGSGYQVTTLREDIATDGRHAVVNFGRDWAADAGRRDFTVNALSVDESGAVHDPLGGYADLRARRIRFIGDADRRIAEDKLRILRFFRFHAEYGEGPLDPTGLSAAISARDGIRDLSAERIGQEMRRLVLARRAAETVAIMQDSGILGIVLGGVGYLRPFARLVEFETALAAVPSVPLRLAALGARIEEDVARLTDRLRLANAERDRILGALAGARSFSSLPDSRAARRALYRLREEAYRDGMALALAWGAVPAAAWRDLYRLPETWLPPSFPLAGRDVLDAGAPRGPAIGELLRAVEAWWIDQDFTADATALKARLEQMIAAER